MGNFVDDDGQTDQHRHVRAVGSLHPITILDQGELLANLRDRLPVRADLVVPVHPEVVEAALFEACGRTLVGNRFSGANRQCK